jgi:hypothetical protein
MDLTALHKEIVLRRHQAQQLEYEFVFTCEHAAARHCPRRQLPPDRANWDRATWGRYLDEATRLGAVFGPRLRRLYAEIERLERLSASFPQQRRLAA